MEVSDSQIDDFAREIELGYPTIEALDTEYLLDQVERLGASLEVEADRFPRPLSIKVHLSPEALHKEVGADINDYMRGYQDLFWVAIYWFGVFVMKIADPEADAIDALFQISKRVDWWTIDGTTLHVSKKPVAALENDAGTDWENLEGPAILYEDGFNLGIVGGTVLPKDWVDNRDTLTPQEILGHPDIEIRAAGARFIGMARMRAGLNAVTIDKETDPLRGELIEVDFPGLERRPRYLVALCPRNGEIYEGVPFEIKTVKEAQAWRCGMTADEYEWPRART